ncbi:ABC transporter ATP-binding protein [Protaetiibacter sp. SSC-01]|uniref:ABC transporter ATP-binding protein n=1 Tax=Protaetiibacter sp. SSC-01 TaxID=2759943 RepID=UPI0016573C00|nr:ABC transporter ATP-binding protein [Protaetiibacter sp. SSC-01]QNO38287.1 ABC transporter ATP-binding protein [Protaetiibacter sp. SSC-01]
MTAAARLTARGWGWRHGDRPRPAVSGLDLDVEPGERVLLLGASGAGKSTLLAGLAGVLGDAEDGDRTGELLVDGRRPEDARGRVGLVLQDPDGQTVLARVGDEVAFGCENLGLPRGEIWRRVAEALDAVGLDVPLDHPTSELSGGQKQRLAIASVLAMRPGLVLLDEPTANLDPDGVAEVREAVARLVASRQTTLVVVEHRVETWVDLVDRVVVLEPGGGVRADGTPDAVLGSRGAELAAEGIWVPGRHPSVPRGRRQADAPELLVADGLAVGRRRFGERQPRTAADGVHLTVRAGRTTAILGPNGAGKSTLGLTLAGLLAPVDGELTALPTLAGRLGPTPIRWRSRELASRIGTVFQDPEHQFLRGTVREELEVGPRALKRPEAEVAAVRDRLAQRLRLTSLLDANPFTLSGGEKRRLSVATALATAPQVLVADEPSFGQDALTWAELVRLLDELVAEGTALVTVTHDLALVDALADDRLLLAGAAAREVVP